MRSMRHQHLARLDAQGGLGTILYLGAGGGLGVAPLLDTSAEHIVLVEPNPDCVRGLNVIAARDRRVAIQPLAIATTDGSAQLHVFNIAAQSSLHAPTHLRDLFPGLNETAVVDVKTKSLSALLEQIPLPEKRDHLLIIDTPGAEHQIAEQLAALEFVPFLHVVLRCAERALYNRASPSVDVLGCLTRRGYRLVAEDNADADFTIFALEFGESPSEESRKLQRKLANERQAQIVENRRLAGDLADLQNRYQAGRLGARDDTTTATPDEPLALRSIHHFACTGGTLISRCIAALPNVRLLSEVDPLSPMVHQSAFVPTDIVGLAKLSSRPANKALQLNVFKAGLTAVANDTQGTGGVLVVRDHAHGHFCYGAEIPDRPSLREMLEPIGLKASLVTVRHPVDSFVSLKKNNWMNFQPATFDEYCRRYLLFLDHYKDDEILRYEDFIDDPQRMMQQVCDWLDLSYNPDFVDIFQTISLSGDSGRKGGAIAARARQKLPDAFATEVGKSPSYETLCDRLGYPKAL